MKTTIRAAAAVVTLFAASAAQAQQAVQWKVENGGNGHWYQFMPVGSYGSWSSARDAAPRLGGHLATITSAAELAFIEGLADCVGCPGYGPSWAIGGFQDRGSPSYSEPIGGWKWINGEPWSFSPWAPGEPNDSGGAEDLLYLHCNLHGFNDGGDPSNGCVAAVIEWSADCNNDGIVDYGQILDDYLSDLDGDNIPDCCEQGVSCGQFGSGMEAYFGFDGDCLDASGNGRHGLSTGLGYTRGPAGLPGTAAAFDGLLSDVRIEGVPIPTNNAFSWALWLRADAVEGAVEGAAIVERIESIGNNLLSPSLFLRPDGALGFGSYSYSSGGTSVETAPNTVTAGSWFHVACTSAQSGLRRVYVNGMLVGENLSVDYGHPLPMILIGRDRLDCCSRFRGAIDDLRFYSRPLTSAEVDALYRAASICPGDITNGGTVDAADLSILLAAWGTNGQAEFDTDIDGSGLVDGGDLALVLGGWGPCPQ